MCSYLYLITGTFTALLVLVGAPLTIFFISRLTPLVEPLLKWKFSKYDIYFPLFRYRYAGAYAIMVAFPSVSRRRFPGIDMEARLGKRLILLSRIYTFIAISAVAFVFIFFVVVRLFNQCK